MADRLCKSEVQDIIEKAKKDNRKGSYPVYSMYKQMLLRHNLSPDDWGTACREIANALEV